MATLVLSLPLLTVVGPGSAAESQEPSLPGSSADATDPPLQENQAADAEAATAAFAGGPTTPILDDFNRQDEYPLSQGGAWAPRDPIGGTQLLAVRAQQAAPPDQNTGNNISYRFQQYPADMELHASIPVKPPDGGAVGLIFNIREGSQASWGSYWLTWDALAGTDTLRVEKATNNQVVNVVVTQVEMSPGDRFMARRIGSQIEGWVYQGGSWQKKLEGTDPSYVGGKIGLFARNTTLRLDDFGGGAFVELT